MPEPAFTAADRVGDADLPVELQGKSPTEIAKYYADREAQLRRELTPPPPPDAPPPPPTTQQFWEKPEQSVRQVAREEFDRMTQSARENLFHTARMVCRDNHPDDVASGIWRELEPQLTAMVNSLEPYQRVSIGMWETAYTQVKGANADRLIRAARESSQRASSEPPSPAASAAPAMPTEIDLSGWPKEKVDKMLDGLSLSKEQYLKAGHRAENGAWPMTFNNVRRKVS